MSTLQYPNTTATYMAVMSLIGIVLWIRSGNIVERTVYGISTAVMVLVAVVAVSKGGWLVLIMGSALLLARNARYLQDKDWIQSGLGLRGRGLRHHQVPARNNGGGRAAPRLQDFLLTAVTVVLGQLVWEGAGPVLPDKGVRLDRGDCGRDLACGRRYRREEQACTSGYRLRCCPEA